MGSKEAGSASPNPSPYVQGETCRPRISQPLVWGCSFLARWQGLLCLRDARLDKDQTSGAGWVPQVYVEERMSWRPKQQGCCG